MRLARGDARLPFMTRVEVFADELGLSHLVPVIRHKLGEELHALRLFPDVVQVLRKLRVTGKRVAVCSNLANAYGPAVRELLPGLDAYIFSYEIGAAKPNPVIYPAACEALDSRPRDVLFAAEVRHAGAAVERRNADRGPRRCDLIDCRATRYICNTLKTPRNYVANIYRKTEGGKRR